MNDDTGQTADFQHRKMSQLIARCWADDDFKRKLLADPEPILEAEGLALPPGGLSIPAKPTDVLEVDLDPGCHVAFYCGPIHCGAPSFATIRT